MKRKSHPKLSIEIFSDKKVTIKVPVAKKNGKVFLNGVIRGSLMKNVTLTIILSVTILTTDGICQKGPARYFDDPILTDSLSTVFIPTRYNEEFLAANKIAIGNEYYANIIVYNYQTDTYKKLFDKDTFIERMRDTRYGNV